MTNAAGYEFSEQENETFKGLVTNMKRSGAVVALASLILLAYHFIGHFGITMGKEPAPIIYWLDLGLWVLISGIGFLVAVLLVKATSAFTAVIHTQGDDVKHLMEGLTRLRGILELLFGAGTLVTIMLGVSTLLAVMYS
jgi:hypothetical protein